MPQFKNNAITNNRMPDEDEIKNISFHSQNSTKNEIRTEKKLNNSTKIQNLNSMKFLRVNNLMTTISSK